MMPTGPRPATNAESVRRDNVTRDFRHGTRGESAARCIGPITKGCDVFGLTKGDFSMIDILRHIAREIGPCRLDVGSWTASPADIIELKRMITGGSVTELRLILGDGFPIFERKGYEVILAEVGRARVRFARFHAKYALLENDNFSIALRTSMNLNMNRRIESYEISEGSGIGNYLRGIADHHFSDDVTAYENFKSFHAGVTPPKAVIAEQHQQRISGWD